MPSWSEVLVLLPYFSETAAVAGLVVTSTLIVLLYDWRLSMLVLLLQYIFANMLLIHFIPAEIALFKFVVGALTCTILFMGVRRTAAEAVPSRHVRWKGGVRVWAHHDVLSVGFSFRLLTVVLIGLIAYTLVQKVPMSGIPAYLNFAVYWLGLTGLLIMMLSVRPWKVGLGLLTFLTAFELYYVTIERGLVVTALIGVFHLVIALSLTYLIITRSAPLNEGLTGG